MTPEQFQDRFKTLEKDFKDLSCRYAPTIAGKTAVRLFKQNFQDEGFFGKAWQEVQRRESWTRTYRALIKRHPADTRREKLSGRTGDLGRSIEYKLNADGSVLISTDPAAFGSTITHVAVTFSISRSISHEVVFLKLHVFFDFIVIFALN
jgi:hypothetical protein